jgi:hypothetical protein
VARGQVGDGVVLRVAQEETVGGIAVGNLFRWNSLLLQLDTPAAGAEVFVEYVHIAAGSAVVAAGARVVRADAHPRRHSPSPQSRVHGACLQG